MKMQLGKTKEAIKYLEDFDAQNDETITPQALFTLANCYATDKQLDKAVDTFKKAAAATDVPALCAEYLLQWYRSRKPEEERRGAPDLSGHQEELPHGSYLCSATAKRCCT